MIQQRGPLGSDATIGILGGGQLGRMLALAAARLGFKCHVLCPDPHSPVPGLSAEECARLAVPTLIFRSGASDPHHTRATSEHLHAVIPGSQLVEPPWGDNEWNERGAAARDGTGALFERWPLLAPQLLEFAAR